MRKYWKYKIWDVLLCVMISLGLTLNLLSGFQIDDVATKWLPYLIVGICLVSLVCGMFAFNKKTAVAGILTGIALFIVVVVLSRSQKWFENEKQNTIQILICVMTIVAVLVFLAGRNRVGRILMLLLGNVLQAGAAFLQFPVSLWGYLLFLAGCGVLIFYHTYLGGLRKAQSGKISLGRFMLQNICICLIALGLTGGVYVGIVRPLNPPTQELKLIQKLMSFEVLEKIGVSTTVTLPNPEEQSEQTDLDDTLATDQREEQNENGMGADVDQADQKEQESGTNDTSQSEELSEKATAITYEAKSHWYLYVIAAAAAVIVFFLSKRWSRKHWLHMVEQLPYKKRVEKMYLYFLKGFGSAGYKKAEHLTLDEYIAQNSDAWKKFETDGVSVMELNQIYQKAYYGQMDISEEEYELFRKFYQKFPEKLCEVMGKGRYALYYLRTW